MARKNTMALSNNVKTQAAAAPVTDTTVAAIVETLAVVDAALAGIDAVETKAEETKVELTLEEQLAALTVAPKADPKKISKVTIVEGATHPKSKAGREWKYGQAWTAMLQQVLKIKATWDVADFKKQVIENLLVAKVMSDRNPKNEDADYLLKLMIRDGEVTVE